MDKILIRRTAARGDVLIAAAVAPALKKKFLGCKIFFYTRCPEMLVGNPYIDYMTSTDVFNNKDFDIIYDLDLCYEKRPTEHILKCYADACYVRQQECQLFMHTVQVDMPLFKDYIVIHAGVCHWVGRNWEQEKWTELALRIHNQGYQIICIGAGEDRFVPCDSDVRNKASIYEAATIIKNAKLFVGIDSLPMHMAQAFNTPGIVFFGSIHPELRLIQPNIAPVRAAGLQCLGCHHRQPAPSIVTNACETKNLECEKLVSVEQMWQAIKQKLNLQ